MKALLILLIWLITMHFSALEELSFVIEDVKSYFRGKFRVSEEHACSIIRKIHYTNVIIQAAISNDREVYKNQRRIQVGIPVVVVIDLV
jgi:hypothetical protein